MRTMTSYQTDSTRKNHQHEFNYDGVKKKEVEAKDDDSVRSSVPSLMSSSFRVEGKAGGSTQIFVVTKSMAFVLLLAVVAPLIDLCFMCGRTARFHYDHRNQKVNRHGLEEEATVVQGMTNKEDPFLTTTLLPVKKKVVNVHDSDNDEHVTNAHAGKLPYGVGQQVLIDLKNIPSINFLQDQDLITNSMMDVLQEIFQMSPNEDEDCEEEEEDDEEEAENDEDVKLQIKHLCHHLSSNDSIAGIYCVGRWTVLAATKKESVEDINEYEAAEERERGNGYFALMTSPLKNVMTLDICVSNNDGGYINDSSTDIAHMAQRIVQKHITDAAASGAAALQGDESQIVVQMNYIHHFRGFYRDWDSNPDIAPPLSRPKDLGKDLNKVVRWAHKEVITSVETDFQQIDIVDFIKTSVQSYEGYLKSIGDDDDDTYEKRHAQFFQPNRVVYLDGISQSTRKGDEPYHEALVQPGMFAHPNPKRAAIIGGGEGATLREILKHETIEHVKMIEIDAIMVETSRKFLPGWNSCDDIVGSTPNCFDEPRADVRMEDALAWFIDRFGPKASIEGEEKFDVIIMDALDPQDNVAFASALYSNDDFTASLFNALTPEGVLVMQLGEAPFAMDVPDEYSTSHMRASLEQDLIRFGFQSLHKYEEQWCGFEVPWSYIVAFKDLKTRRNWFQNEAQINMKIQKRLRPSKTIGTSLLKNFDGATMKRYQVPTRGFETVLCRAPSFIEENESHQSLCHDAFSRKDDSIDILSPFLPVAENSTTSNPLSSFLDTYGVKNPFLGDEGYVVSTNDIRTLVERNKSEANSPGGNTSMECSSNEGEDARTDSNCTSSYYGMEYRNSGGVKDVLEVQTVTVPASYDFNAVVARRLPHLIHSSV